MVRESERLEMWRLRWSGRPLSFCKDEMSPTQHTPCTVHCVEIPLFLTNTAPVVAQPMCVSRHCVSLSFPSPPLASSLSSSAIGPPVAQQATRSRSGHTVAARWNVAPVCLLHWTVALCVLLS